MSPDLFRGLDSTIKKLAENKWITMDPASEANKTFQLGSTARRSNPSPFEKYIKAVCDPKRVPKWKAFEYLVRNVWKLMSKVVITYRAPVTVINIHWVSLLIERVEARLLRVER